MDIENINKNISIIDYNTTLNLLLYSIIIYKLNNDEINIYNKNILKNHFINLQYKSIYTKNDELLKIFYCEITNILCMIIRNNKEKIIKIIFRGTKNTKNLYYNLNIQLKPIKFLDNINIKIHEGFYNHFFENNFYNKIKNFLQKIDCKNYLFQLSGHSLGANLSILCGYFLSYIFYQNKILIVSFGSSKIGNEHFKQSFDNKDNILCYRFINQSDYINNLPPIHYYHIGIPIKLKSTKNNLNLIECHSYNHYLNNLLNSKW